MNFSHKIPKYLKSPKKSPKKWLFYGIGFLALGALFIFGRNYLKRSFSESRVVSKIIGAVSLQNSAGRINILALGVDRRAKLASQSAVLTDTIMIGSLAEDGSNASVISIPRDLWVPYASTPYSGKINAVYAWGGIPAVMKTVERVFAVPINYYVVVGFEGFVKAVDTVGGVKVQVERSFDDYQYPIEGKEDVLPEEDRYTHIHFDEGEQILSGERALQFVRSRHALGDEGSDFARAARQQKVILAFKDRIFSAQTLFNPSKIKILYDIFKDTVETNVSLEEVLAFYDLAKRLESSNIKSFVLNDNLLYNPQDTQAYGGAWVLLPKAGDFSQVQEFLREITAPASGEQDAGR